MAAKKKSIPEQLEDGLVDTVKKVAKNVEAAVEEVVETLEGAKKDDRKSKLEALKAKAKALEGKLSEKKIDIKSEVKGEKEEKKDTLVPIEDYLKSSIHLGTRVITPDMRTYVYRRRADGLAVFNTALLDEKIREGAEFLSRYSPEQIVVVCKREAGWKAVNKFAETLGIKVFTKKYPAGVLTNTNLENFFEKELVFICDPWLDKNALNDSRRVKIDVMSICDTNNFTDHIKCIIPGNNKSWKSLGMIFYLLTKLYIEKRKLDIPIPAVQEFVEGWDSLQPPV
jgi:small subunit ribosomal protein S2